MDAASVFFFHCGRRVWQRNKWGFVDMLDSCSFKDGNTYIDVGNGLSWPRGRGGDTVPENQGFVDKVRWQALQLWGQPMGSQIA